MRAPTLVRSLEFRRAGDRRPQQAANLSGRIEVVIGWRSRSIPPEVLEARPSCGRRCIEPLLMKEQADAEPGVC